MNRDDRVAWVNNHAQLYSLWVASGIGIYRFAQENRELIDRMIREENERKPDNHRIHATCW